MHDRHKELHWEPQEWIIDPEHSQPFTGNCTVCGKTLCAELLQKNIKMYSILTGIARMGSLSCKKINNTTL